MNEKKSFISNDRPLTTTNAVAFVGPLSLKVQPEVKNARMLYKCAKQPVNKGNFDFVGLAG